MAQTRPDETRNAPRAAGPRRVSMPLGPKFEGDTVDVVYEGGGELTLRSRVHPGVAYNFTPGNPVRVDASDAPRLLAHKDFKKHTARAMSDDEDDGEDKDKDERRATAQPKGSGSGSGSEGSADTGAGATEATKTPTPTPTPQSSAQAKKD